MTGRSVTRIRYIYCMLETVTASRPARLSRFVSIPGPGSGDCPSPGGPGSARGRPAATHDSLSFDPDTCITPRRNRIEAVGAVPVTNGSPGRSPAVRFLQISRPVFPQHSDAAFVAADPEALFHA